MRPKHGEKLASFFARIDSERSSLSNMFKHILSDDDIFSIIQQSIPKEFLFTYMEMQNQKKSLMEVRRAMIALEIAMARRTSEKRHELANSANEFISRNFDRHHNRMDSPQRGRYRYQDSDPRKSSSPGRLPERKGATYVSKADADASRSSFQRRDNIDKNSRTERRGVKGPYS